MKLSNTFHVVIGKSHLLRSTSLGLAAATLLTGAHGTLAQSAPEVGLVSSDQYIGQQFLWNASWSGDWTADQEQTVSVPGQYEQLVLHGDKANVGVQFSYATMADAFAREVEPYDSAGGATDVLSADVWESDAGVPYLLATIAIASDNGPLIEYVEVAPAMDYSITDGSQVTMLVAPEADFEQAFQDAQNEILPNDGNAGPLFVGTPADIPGNASSSIENGQSSVPSSDSTSESAYLDALNSEIDTLTQSMTDFQTVIESPTFGDQASKTELAGILFTWIASYDTAQSIQPPAQFVEMHQTYVDFTSLLAGAAQAIAYSDFDTAGKDLSEAQTKLMRLERMLESGGADIFDVKAG
jgi:hypothetical protein